MACDLKHVCENYIGDECPFRPAAWTACFKPLTEAPKTAHGSPSILKRLVMRWRYNRLKSLAGDAFRMSIKYEQTYLPLQKAAKLIGDAADILRRETEKRGA